MDKRLYNVNMLGLSFMFILAANQAMGNIAKTLLSSVQRDYPLFTGDGYISLSITYFVFALANWIAPSIVNFTGCKIAMIIGAICYTMFLVSYLWLTTFILYFMSAIQGFGAAILWTAQGTYLTLNSDPSTMSRNTGIFWTISNISMLLGNAFVSYALRDKSDFDDSTRTFIYIVLIIVSAFGTLLFLFLRSPVNQEGTLNERVEIISFTQEIKNTMSLFLTKDMRLLNITFFFTGLSLSFYSSVYSSSIGFTKRMGFNSKQLVGLSGLFIGIGEILGGLIFSILGQKTSDNNTTIKGLSHSAVIAIGFIVNIITYGLIIINLPDDSPFGDTTASSYINPNYIQFQPVPSNFLQLSFGFWR
ncbi:UNC93-like protein MFSD11 isoform X2 [Melanaphis sacchari]|uniref:UNC93-like protein MFSD11 isoform X2 n=1 Tax=Melanaphis sacchari TaxID=742174 RepID=UPI000DC14819|nr:UNC93-like protein MFSD11 isoform X2 [Melanaphis sacchari]